MGNTEERPCDFFVSYNKADRAWAVWIARIVEEMGFRAMVQDWDFRPGTNWVQKMNEGVQGCDRMIAVLSPDYQNSVYGAAEWQAMWARDAQGTDRRLLPVRVSDFKVLGLLSTVVYIDVFGTDETTARGLLEDMLGDASSGRAKPDAPPPFPGDQPSRERAPFPGAPPAEQDSVIEGETTGDNVRRMSDFRNPLDVEHFRRLITEVSEPAELVGASYAAGTPEYSWTRLAVERQLTHINTHLASVSEYLRGARMSGDLTTFTLRHFILRSADAISAFSRTLDALEATPGNSRRHRLLDEYEAAWRSLEALLWKIHDELLTQPPSGSR
jgi:TIR domain-containing protein